MWAKDGQTVLDTSSVSRGDFGDLEDRVSRTLQIMHRWGFAPTTQSLAARLLGGPVKTAELLPILEDSPRFAVQGGFAALRGSCALIPGSQERVAGHGAAATYALRVATKFASEMARHVPFVDCVALSGSLASGGFHATDDIDFDLFVHDGTKYITYLIALVMGAAFSIRFARTYGLRKLICLNVIWTREQTRPFERNDDGLAFELLNCDPLVGGRFFQEVLLENPWLDRLFPQTRRRVTADLPMDAPSPFARFLRWVERDAGRRRLAERWSRRLSFVIYTVIHRMRSRDSTSAARLEFLRRVKFPYEVFQDAP